MPPLFIALQAGSAQVALEMVKLDPETLSNAKYRALGTAFQYAQIRFLNKVKRDGGVRLHFRTRKNHE